MKLNKYLLVYLFLIIIYLIVWFGGFVYPLFEVSLSPCPSCGYVVDFFGVTIKLDNWYLFGSIILMIMILLGIFFLYYLKKKKKL